MKTLAQFKRDAASGKMSLELFERFGSTEITDQLKGIRKVARTNTVGITLVNKDGTESQLRFTNAKLFEYTRDTVIIYKAGLRDLTEQEQSILDKWEKVKDEYIKQNYYAHDNLYWKMKDYFAKCPCPWMCGSKKVRGKMYCYDGKVIDDAVKGEPILKYHVYMET